MKLQHLSDTTGVPITTVKFYVREGLLPHGQKVNATTARYGQEHVERLELIRDLRQVLGLPLDRVREAVAAVDRDDPVVMMGRIQTIVLGLSDPLENGVVPPLDTSGSSRLTAEEVVRAMDWLPGTPSSMAALSGTFDEMARWGLEPELQSVLVYARAADSVASSELGLAPDAASGSSSDRLARYVALGVHFYSRLLTRLLAVAQGSYARRVPSTVREDLA